MSEYIQNIVQAFTTVAIGMKITLKHLFKPKVTIQYPSVKRDLPERVRNRLYVNMDDCIGCDQCARACPVNCITIETIKALPTDDLGTTSTGNKKRLWVPVFDIDIAKCCYCALCVYPCPTECIFMTDVFEFSEYKRENLVYKFATMTPEEIAAKRLEAEEFQRAEEAKKAAAAEAKKKAAETAAKKAAEEKTEAAQSPDKQKETPSEQ